jgi:hypothetical protein
MGSLRYPGERDLLGHRDMRENNNQPGEAWGTKSTQQSTGDDDYDDGHDGGVDGNADGHDSWVGRYDIWEDGEDNEDRDDGEEKHTTINRRR